jgi:hypothetical protein
MVAEAVEAAARHRAQSDKTTSTRGQSRLFGRRTERQRRTPPFRRDLKGSLSMEALGR